MSSKKFKSFFLQPERNYIFWGKHSKTFLQCTSVYSVLQWDPMVWRSKLQFQCSFKGLWSKGYDISRWIRVLSNKKISLFLKQNIEMYINVWNPAPGDPLSWKLYFQPVSTLLACDFSSDHEDVYQLLQVCFIGLENHCPRIPRII